MKTLTETERRELELWLAEHLFGWAPTFAVMKGDLYYRSGGHGYTGSIYKAGCYSKDDAEKELVRGEPMRLVPHERPHYTTNRAAAFDVLEKCLERTGTMPIITQVGKLFVWANPVKLEPFHDADTLPLAICLFAKQLFEK